MARARGLARTARTRLLAIDVLLPAYQRAVAATDTAAVRALVQQLVGEVALVIDAQGEIVRLVPLVDNTANAAHVSTAATDAGPADADQLAALTAEVNALDASVTAKLVDLVVKVSPQMFGLLPTAVEVVPVAGSRTFERFVAEAELVGEIMEAADSIEAMVTPTDGARGTSQAPDKDAQGRALEQLAHWKSRPANFYFLRCVLMQRGVWERLNGRDLHGRSPTELANQVDQQAAETGPIADVGGWEATEADHALVAGAPEWAVTGDGAMVVFRRLADVDPDTRGGLVRQLANRGLLERLCHALPWPLVKQLWESIPDPVASKMLEPYWSGNDQVQSLGKMLDGNIATRALSKFLDVATIGAKPRIDAAYDAGSAGTISDNDVAREATSSVMRAGLVAAAMAATGGAAGAYAGGIAAGAGAGEGGALVTEVMLGTATAGVGGQFAGDVYDQARGDKHGFDSVASYGQTFATGGLLAGVLAPLGLAAARFMPAAMRTIAQETAATHPEWTSVLESARAAGVGTSTTVRLTVRNFLDSMRGGGPPPGFRFAYAGAGASSPIPPDIVDADPATVVVLTVKPLVDLNGPQQTLREGDAVVEVERVDRSEEFAEHYAEMAARGGGNRADGIYEAGADGSFAGEESLLGESGPEVGALQPRRNKPDAGVVPNEGDRIKAQHHVFPQEKRSWFEKHGIDIDDFCIDLTRPDHEAQHGGGGWGLARRVALKIPEAEWNAAMMKALNEAEADLRLVRGRSAKLSPKEVVDVGLEVMEQRDVGKEPFRRYTGRAKR